MVTKYKFKEYTFGQLKDEIELPKFQRSLVWSDNQKKGFISSALEGDPFGVLLLYDDVKTRKLIVVDGLQRFTTLRKYDENPFDFFEIRKENYEEIEEIQKLLIDFYPDESEENVLDQILSSIKQVIAENELKRATQFPDFVVRKIIYLYPQVQNMPIETKILKLLYSLWRKIENKIFIDGLLVPSIVFQGDEAHLPVIFERLNQGGTKLSKYEVFASSWNNIVLSGADNDITGWVERRYNKIMEETDLHIEGYVEGSINASQKVTLYEYALAFGKIIKKRFKNLFPSKKINDDDVIDSIGFSTLITFLGKHLKHMSELKKYINDSIKPSVLSRLKTVILNVFAEVEEILTPYVGDFNKYTEAQLLSVCYTWFNINYEFDIDSLTTKEKVGNKHLKDQFKKNMPYRYLNDIIRSSWSGHGDNTLFEIMHTPMNQNRYLVPIEEGQWRMHLEEWMEAQKHSSSKNFTADTKLFYAFLLSQMGEDLSDAYVATHIIPKSAIEQIQAMVPISPAANLYFIPKMYAKEYKNRFIPNALGYQKITWPFPKKEMVSFNHSGMPSKSEYERFIDTRNNELIEAFLSCL